MVNLDELNQVALGLKTVNGALDLSISGDSFDARRLINQMFTASGPPPTAGIPVTVQASVARVYANRGEIIDELSGQLEINNGVVQRADLTGQFVNGGPVTLKITPAGQGTRDMRVVGRDAGSGVSGPPTPIPRWPAAASAFRPCSMRERNPAFSAACWDPEFPGPQRGGAQQSRRAGRSKKASGPRRDGLSFTRLTLPFSADQRFVRIGDALVQELGDGRVGPGASSARRMGGWISAARSVFPPCAQCRP